MICPALCKVDILKLLLRVDLVCCKPSVLRYKLIESRFEVFYLLHALAFSDTWRACWRQWRARELPVAVLQMGNRLAMTTNRWEGGEVACARFESHKILT